MARISLLIVITVQALVSCKTVERQEPPFALVGNATEGARRYSESYASLNDFDRFLRLCQLGRPIPHDLIYEHTQLSNPKGNFYAIDIRAVYHQIEGIVLIQQTDHCERTFLLTTDGQRVLDQALIAETCPSIPQSTRSTYYWNGSRRVIRTYMKAVAKTDDLPRTVYRIGQVGEIQVVAMN